MYTIGDPVAVPTASLVPSIGKDTILGTVVARKHVEGEQIITVKDVNGEFWTGFAFEARSMKVLDS